MRKIRMVKAAASIVAAVGLILSGSVAASADESSRTSGSDAAAAVQEEDGTGAEQFETIDEIDMSSGSFEPAPVTFAPMASSSTIWAGDCGYQQHVDDAHITRGEMSVHGWWTTSTPSKCPDTARVTVYLQAWFCSSISGCRWVTVEKGERTIAPRTAKRANARNVCAASKLVGWRGVTDVDLTGKVDPAGVTYGTAYDRMCEPSN